MNRERALASLSTITVVWETRNEDYLDNFVPFIATYATARDIESISRDDLHSLANGLYDLFGISVPVLPLKAILKKAKKQKILISAGSDYRVNKPLAMEASIMGDIRTYERTYAQVVDAFQEFVAAHYDLKLSDSEAEEVLYGFVNSNDLGVLSHEHSDQKASLRARLPRKHRQYEYLVNAFYVNASERNSVVYESISKMAMGSVLSAAIFLPEIPDRSQTVRGIEFVLDTPLLLKLIGADGTAEQAVVRHLLDAIKAQGGTLVTYSHIHDETLEILDSARRWVESTEFDCGKASRTTIFFRQEGFSQSDIVRLIAKIGDRYSESGIIVKDVPDYNPNGLHQIDEGNLVQILEEIISERASQFNAEQYKRRTLRDVDTISAVYRSRCNHRPQVFRDCRVVLITENTALVLANRKIVDTIHPELSGFPACVTDQYVGTVLWINAPEAAIAVNRSRLLASSSAALRPDASLAKAIVIEANRLRQQGEITDDDVVILTSDHLLKDLLAEKTLGDAEALDSPKVIQILSEVKARLLESAHCEIDKLNYSLESESEQKLALTIDRDQTRSAVVGYAERKAKRIASAGKLIFRFVVWLSILAPILPAILIHPLIGSVSIILAVAFNLVGYKGVNADLVYSRLYALSRARKLRAIGVSDNAAIPDK